MVSVITATVIDVCLQRLAVMDNDAWAVETLGELQTFNSKFSDSFHRACLRWVRGVCGASTTVLCLGCKE
jgi:hypothetical protein